MPSLPEALEVLRRDGFVVVESFFRIEDVRQAHREILDLRAGLEHAAPGEVRLIRVGRSTEILTHLHGASPALDRLVAQVLGDPASSALLERIGGRNLKNRDYTVRLMTGEPDEWRGYNPPLEWHRDSKGEFVLGIYLTDIPPGDNSATAFLPGTFRYPYDPRWNALFGRPFYLGSAKLQRKYGAWHGLSLLLPFAFFGRLLGKRETKNATGAFGKAGDFYLFINETWHGRLPNKHGARAAVVQLGFFPAEFPFPDNPAAPPEATLARLPEPFRRTLDRQQQPNPAGVALVYEILASQQSARAFSLLWFARIERKLAALLSYPFAVPLEIVKRAARKLLSRRVLPASQVRVD